MNLIKNIFLLPICLYSLTDLAQAQDDSTSLFTEILEEKVDLKLGGMAEVDHISYLQSKSKNKIYSRNQGLLHLNLNSKIGNKARMYSQIEVREDLSDPARNRIFMQEAYMDIYLNKLDVRVGKQVITWGTADAINFTSNINPYNFTDLLDVRYQTIGVFSAKADYFVSDWKFTGVLIPVFNPNILPASNSPWSTPLPERVPNPFDPTRSFHADYEFINPVLPSKDINSIQYAVKVATTLGKVDLSASYYNGYNDLPVQFLQTIIPLNMDSVNILIQPEYRPWQIIGADFASVLGKFSIRGEAAYYITDNSDKLNAFNNEPYLQYVLGIDRRFDKGLILLQWLHEFTSNNQSFSPQDLNHIFQKSMMARVEYTIGDYTKIAVKGVYNLEAEDYYIRPELTYEITSGLNLTLLADILDGPSQGFFGQYKDNDRVQARLKYNF